MQFYKDITPFFLIIGIPIPLQPRPATTGINDILPLHPRYLPTFEREIQSEPRELQDQTTTKHELSLKCSSEPTHIQESDMGSETRSMKALTNSTEVEVDGQNEIGFLFPSSTNNKATNDDKNSPDFDYFKSPSTEFTTSTVDTTPIDENNGNMKNMKDEIYTICDMEVDRESKRYFV